MLVSPVHSITAQIAQSSSWGHPTNTRFCCPRRTAKPPTVPLTQEPSTQPNPPVASSMQLQPNQTISTSGVTTQTASQPLHQHGQSGRRPKSLLQYLPNQESSFFPSPKKRSSRSSGSRMSGCCSVQPVCLRTAKYPTTTISVGTWIASWLSDHPAQTQTRALAHSHQDHRHYQARQS